MARVWAICHDVLIKAITEHRSGRSRVMRQNRGVVTGLYFPMQPKKSVAGLLCREADDYHVNVELTATEHVGFHKQPFPGNRQRTAYYSTWIIPPG